MFSIFKKKNKDIEQLYDTIQTSARQPILYADYGVPDTPHGRFQMIILHAAPFFTKWAAEGNKADSQALFDTIFQDIEYSFREIGVSDLSVPKKMKKYMKNFNAVIHAHAAANADHVEITRRNVFGDDVGINNDFKHYIKGLFA